MFKDKSKTIVERIAIQDKKINELVDEMNKAVEIVNGYTTDEETRVANEQVRIEYYNQRKEEINSINEQLDNKANKNEIFTMANMGQDIKEAMTGGSVAVVGKNTILTENIVDKQVTVDKTNFIELDENYNLFLKEKAKQGGYYNPSTGVWINSTSHGVSDFISCKSGDKITQNGKLQIIYWNNAKEIVSSTSYPSPEAPLFTVVPNDNTIAYFTVAFSLSNINNFIVIKNKDWDSLITSENAYKSNKLKIYNENFSKNLKITSDYLTDDINAFFSNVELFSTENLLNIDNLTSGYPNPSTGVWTSSDNHWTSDFIPSQKLKTYTQNSALFTAYYDSDKNLLGTTATAKTKTLPDNDSIAYIRAIITTSDKNDLYYSMFVEGTVYPSQYIPYQQIKFKPNIFDFGINVDSKLKGLTWNVLGDSITYSGGYGDPETNFKTYHQLIAEECGCIVNNYGVGGTTITIRDGYNDSFLERYSNMADADIITVFGGVNDLIKNVPIGTFGNGNNKTFYGAFEELIVGLINKYPSKIVAVILPCQKKGAYDTFLPYIEAEEKICKKYSIPYVDIFRKGGLCADIQTDYYDSYGTHPWTKGVRKFAPKIKNFLENMI